MATAGNTYEQVYNISEDDSLPSRVSAVIAVVMQRGLLAAGFSSKGEVLILHYTGYNKNRPVWELNFFEHLLAQETLFADKDKVKGIFILGSSNMVVPDELYDKAAAEQWMKSIYFIEQTDLIRHFPVKEAKASYVLAVPVYITELIRINFKKSVTLPAQMPAFARPRRQGTTAHCIVTAEQASIVLHHNGQLLWHKVLDYRQAEDIAYPLLQVCGSHNIAPASVAMLCDATGGTEFTVFNHLSQYFPALTCGDGAAMNWRWDGAISLAQQLIACV